jgi:hypothetical protein
LNFCSEDAVRISYIVALIWNLDYFSRSGALLPSDTYPIERGFIFWREGRDVGNEWQ